MKTKRVIYRGKKPLGPAMGVRLYNQHYQILMKQVRNGGDSYQQLIRDIVDGHFKQERLAHKRSTEAPKELGVDTTWVLSNLHSRVSHLEELCAPLEDKGSAQ